MSGNVHCMHLRAAMIAHRSNHCMRLRAARIARR